MSFLDWNQQEALRDLAAAGLNNRNHKKLRESQEDLRKQIEELKHQNQLPLCGSCQAKVDGKPKRCPYCGKMFYWIDGVRNPFLSEAAIAEYRKSFTLERDKRDAEVAELHRKSQKEAEKKRQEMLLVSKGKPLCPFLSEYQKKNKLLDKILESLASLSHEKDPRAGMMRDTKNKFNQLESLINKTENQDYYFDERFLVELEKMKGLLNEVRRDLKSRPSGESLIAQLCIHSLTHSVSNFISPDKELSSSTLLHTEAKKGHVAASSSSQKSTPVIDEYSDELYLEADPSGICSWMANQLLKILGSIVVSDKKLTATEVKKVVEILMSLGSFLQSDETLKNIVIASCKDIAKTGPLKVFQESLNKLNTIDSPSVIKFLQASAHAVAEAEGEVSESVAPIIKAIDQLKSVTSCDELIPEEDSYLAKYLLSK